MTTEQKSLLQEFQRQLNREPDPTEFDKTPDGKARTLPISFVEMTLDEIFFGLWSTENFHWSAITNEVQGSLELVLTHPISGQIIKRTGAASIVITVDSLTDEDKAGMTKQARNLHALNPENKKPNALDLAFPKLKAECVKNAAQSLGKVFGRDINRRKTDTFKPTLVALGPKGFMDMIARVEGGEHHLIAFTESNFILSPDQQVILNGYKNNANKLLN